MDRSNLELPPIPAKRYFTIGEVSELCRVKPYVLRYWEQEFVQLKPMKRRGNRRYYQHHEVLLVRRIRELLYDQGFTISGARNRLSEAGSLSRVQPDVDQGEGSGARLVSTATDMPVPWAVAERGHGLASFSVASRALQSSSPVMAESGLLLPELPDFSLLSPEAAASLRASLLSIRDLLA
jgi:DNA-binding transcriptional MerR regulator